MDFQHLWAKLRLLRLGYFYVVNYLSLVNCSDLATNRKFDESGCARFELLDLIEYLGLGCYEPDWMTEQFAESILYLWDWENSSSLN